MPRVKVTTKQKQTVDVITPSKSVAVLYRKGEKGDPFLYSDFTDEQLEALKVKGDQGEQGPQGDPFLYSYFTNEQLEALKVKGDQGDQGERGYQGDQGEKGDKGDTGETGPKGDKGDTGIGIQGDQGIQGIPGAKGDKGDTGSQGEQGDIGSIGPMGEIKPDILYGKLYNAYCLLKIAGSNAHVPTFTEWQILYNYLGGDPVVAGNKVMERGFWNVDNPNNTNETKFNIRGSGWRFQGSFNFAYKRGNAFIWGMTDNFGNDLTTTIQSNTNFQGFDNSGWTCDLGYHIQSKAGASVRLIVDTPNEIYDTTHGKYTGNDGFSYNCIKIGTQWWLNQNLIETKLNDGTDIPDVQDTTDWGNLTTPGRCNYDNDISNAYSELSDKVDKEQGKGLSTFDYNQAERESLVNVISGLGQSVLSTIAISNLDNSEYHPDGTGPEMPFNFRQNFAGVGQWQRPTKFKSWDNGQTYYQNIKSLKLQGPLFAPYNWDWTTPPTNSDIKEIYDSGVILELSDYVLSIENGDSFDGVLGAFCGCTGLLRVTLQNCLKFGAHTFDGITTLVNLTLNNSLLTSNNGGPESFLATVLANNPGLSEITYVDTFESLEMSTKVDKSEGMRLITQAESDWLQAQMGV